MSSNHKTLPSQKDQKLKARGFDGDYLNEGGFKANKVVASSEWQVNMADRKGAPLLLGRKMGKGRMLASGLDRTFAQLATLSQLVDTDFSRLMPC